MIIVRLLAGTVAAFAASITAGHAGPCSAEIDHMQARIDSALEAKAGTGPSARESIGATMSRQPTPGSIAAAEEKLGEVSPQTAAAVSQAMARARASDSSGDRSACEAALAAVNRAIGH